MQVKWTCTQPIRGTLKWAAANPSEVVKKRGDSKPVGKEEDAEPIDAERRGARDEDGSHINPAAPLVDGCAFRAHEDDRRRYERRQACDQVHPAEREEVEVHADCPEPSPSMIPRR